MRLAPGVLRIPTGTGDRDNAFLVDGDDGYTLVDVGWKRAPAAIRAALDEASRSIQDITKIVITHAHPDHVRGLAEVVAMTSAAVLIHRLDAPWLRGGRVPATGRSSAIGRVLDAAPLLHWKPVAPDVLLDGGEVIDGLRVINTPGHSPGHIVLLHEPTNALLVGDAVFHRGDDITTGPDMLAMDPGQRGASVKLLPHDVAAVGFAHGSPLTGTAVDKFEAFLQSSRTRPMSSTDDT
jgi:glyoxylase-like metal-dependent hydrolase (beta-lactamase superfamily II)